jgi:hypothetical protein
MGVVALAVMVAGAVVLNVASMYEMGVVKAVGSALKVMFMGCAEPLLPVAKR